MNDDTDSSLDGDFSPGCSSVEHERSDSESSCVSIKSDQSLDWPFNFKGGETWPPLSPVHEETSEPEPSDVSIKSDQSEEFPFNFKGGDTRCTFRPILPPRPVVTEPICKKKKYDQSMNLPQDFNESMFPGFSYDSEFADVLNTFRLNMKTKFRCLYEGTAKQGNPTLLNKIYTELYITESESGEISYEHEARLIEKQSRRTTTEDSHIKCNDIFKPLPGQDIRIRTVLTKGVAGIGKTVSVQKFILDWAEGKANQDIHLIFPLPFRELNLVKDKKLSISDLLHISFPEATEIDISSDKYKVLLIFDGLDDCNLSLDFQSNVRFCDVCEPSSVDVLLTNLMKGNLLPSALIWITCRPEAADLIPSECVDRVTEVRGFNEPQKE